MDSYTLLFTYLGEEIAQEHVALGERVVEEFGFYKTMADNHGLYSDQAARAQAEYEVARTRLAVFENHFLNKARTMRAAS